MRFRPYPPCQTAWQTASSSSGSARRHMTSAFVIGCGVAGAAYALKGVLHVGSKVAQNPEAMKQATALGAGLKGAGSVFRMPSFMSFTKHAGGFDAAMNRREAALILNCRRVLPAHCVHAIPHHRLPPPPPPSASTFTSLHLHLHLHLHPTFFHLPPLPSTSAFTSTSTSASTSTSTSTTLHAERARPRMN